MIWSFANLTAQAHALELDVLCEVHTAEELDRILDLDCDAVGVNNRDLRTFAVRLEVSLDLASRLPAAAVHVSESGIETAEDMNRLRAAGFHAFLIGESLMRQPEPGTALETLLLAAADALTREQLSLCGSRFAATLPWKMRVSRQSVARMRSALFLRQVQGGSKLTRFGRSQISCPRELEKYGVFVDAGFDEIVSTVTASGLTGVQLHRTSDALLPSRLRRHFAGAGRHLAGLALSGCRTSSSN